MRKSCKEYFQEVAGASGWSIIHVLHIDHRKLGTQIEKESTKIGQNWLHDGVDILWYEEGMVVETAVPQYHLEMFGLRICFAQSTKKIEKSATAIVGPL